MAKDTKGLGFYNLEDEFGGRGSRVDLIHAIEYCRIDGRFDEDTYKAIEANAPVEANTLRSSYEPEDVEFY